MKLRKFEHGDKLIEVVIKHGQLLQNETFKNTIYFWNYPVQCFNSTLEKEIKNRYMVQYSRMRSTYFSVIKEKKREDMYKDKFIILHYQQGTCNPLSSRSKFEPIADWSNSPTVVGPMIQGTHRDIKIMIFSYRDEYEIIEHEPQLQQESFCNW